MTELILTEYFSQTMLTVK